MKTKHGKNMVIIIPLIAIFVGLGIVNSTFGDSPDILISMVKNDVKVKKATASTWQKAKVNMPLSKGDCVKTGDNSFATLKFSYPKDNCFQLYQNTEVIVGELMKGEDKPLKIIRMSMLKGGTWAKLKGMEDKDLSFKLSTPNTVAAISGTALATIVYGDNETYFCACDGVIDIGTPGNMVTIKRCEGTSVKGDKPPSFPLSDKYIIMDKKYEKDPRYGWCIHCHSMMMKKKCAPKTAPKKASCGK
jgi:hypothetical protein